MATRSNITSATVQQPGLRSFIIYDRLPAGSAAYPVMDDRNAPHLHVGETVVVDPRDHTPSTGELFLIQYLGDETPRIVETFKLPKIPGWCVGATRQPAFAKDMQGRWCDFPYTTEKLEARLLGRVIGILEAAFAEPVRIAA